MTIIPNLEREGGHIAILFVLLLICIFLSYSLPENQLVVKVGDLSLGALLLAMKGNGDKTSAATDQVKADRAAGEPSALPTVAGPPEPPKV